MIISYVLRPIDHRTKDKAVLPCSDFADVWPPQNSAAFEHGRWRQPQESGQSPLSSMLFALIISYVVCFFMLQNGLNMDRVQYPVSSIQQARSTSLLVLMYQRAENTSSACLMRKVMLGFLKPCWGFSSVGWALV